MATFQELFADLFNGHFQRVFRYLHRMSGERELAADIAQEAFIRLYRRGSAPEIPEAWLITVATNLLRNARSGQARRARLLKLAHARELVPSPETPAARPDEGSDTPERVREALDRMSERERGMLLLRAEGYSYRDIAAALELNEASVGTLLARAKRAFRGLYEEGSDAPR